jgi:hypothetical protein
MVFKGENNFKNSRGRADCWLTPLRSPKRIFQKCVKNYFASPALCPGQPWRLSVGVAVCVTAHASHSIDHCYCVCKYVNLFELSPFEVWYYGYSKQCRKYEFQGSIRKEFYCYVV